MSRPTTLIFISFFSFSEVLCWLHLPSWQPKALQPDQYKLAAQNLYHQQCHWSLSAVKSFWGKNRAAISHCFFHFFERSRRCTDTWRPCRSKNFLHHNVSFGNKLYFICPHDALCKTKNQCPVNVGSLFVSGAACLLCFVPHCNVHSMCVLAISHCKLCSSVEQPYWTEARCQAFAKKYWLKLEY